MPDQGKRNLLGVLIDCVDRETATRQVLAAARAAQPLSVSALAVHGVMAAVMDAGLRHRVNGLDLAVADGQPVRWGLNLLHRVGLPDAVRGTDLTLAVAAGAAADDLPVFFYGSRRGVLEALVANVCRRHPTLTVAGTRPSLFRSAAADDRDRIVDEIKTSGARITFVGLGCPRQEVFASELRDALGMPVLAVGAAFDYIARSIPEPPRWVGRLGLEWAWRLVHEPRRLWRRYLLLNPAYLLALGLQALGVWRPSASTDFRPAALPL